MRAGRSAQHIGRKGKSKQRWIVGGKLCLLLHQLGLVVAWDCAGANAPDPVFHPLSEICDGEMIVLSDTVCYAKEGAPFNFKLCDCGFWHTCLLVETVL